MSKTIAQLPSAALPSSHPDADAGRAAGVARERLRPDGAPLTDVAELSAAARRRLAQASRLPGDGVSNAQRLADQVAEAMHQGIETGALHHVAVGTIARLIK